MKREDALNKLAKLLRLSKSPNEHEAKLAATKAREIMDEFGLTEGEAIMADARAGKTIVGQELFTVPDCAMKYVWLYTMGQGVAKLFDGVCVTNNRLHGTSFLFVGHEMDREAMKMLFLHLWESWQSIVERDLALAKEDHVKLVLEGRRLMKWEPRNTMKFKLGHGQGFADAILKRCSEIARKREAEQNQCVGLMVVKKDALARYSKEEGFRSTTKHQSRGAEDGYHRGAVSGSAVPLGGGIGGRGVAGMLN